MGMYDSVYVPCPKCGELTDFQTKSGNCTLSEYTLENAPEDVLFDINRHSPYTCNNCQTKFSVKITYKTEVVIEDD